MKRLLLPLLAALALPTAANAESVWLVIGYAEGVTKVLVESMEQCEEQGKKFASSKGNAKGRVDQKRYWCVVGK
tara:strand:+ start:257 stop:478 length:222 start_codon:yes stop_codon:yes gene_type:complete